VKAQPTSATQDLSYILSHPILDRSLRRNEVMFDLQPDKRRQRHGQFADPACMNMEYPALQGEPSRWNKALWKRQVKRDANPHKAPNKRSKAVQVQWVLLGVMAALRTLQDLPNPFWQALLTKASAEGQEQVLEHVTAYMHMSCSFNTTFSVFKVSSHMASNCLRKRGRSYQSSFCLVHAQDLLHVTPPAHAGDLPGEQMDGLVPVYVMYFSRLEFHSGASVGEGETVSMRAAYVHLLPATLKHVHGHVVFRYDREAVSMESTQFHRLVSIESITAPLIVDSSVEKAITLIPFQGKGLEQLMEEEFEVLEASDIDWENVDDVMQ
jgi:hypothetical protein